MGVSPRTFLGISLIVIGLLAAGCTNPDDAVTADGTGTAVAAATDGPAASPTSELPDWVRDRIESGDLDGDGIDDDLVRYVAFTGGGGVSHRSACENSARLDDVWAEGTPLEVVASNSGECDGWTLMTDGETTSWVLNKYLDEEKPAPASGGGGGGAPSGGGWVQAIQYQQSGWFIAVSELRVAPAGETWCEADSWHDPAGGDYLVSTVDGTPFVNPDPIRCGFGSVNSTPVIWVQIP